jgi:tripartite-type tricarboxylate transporter receptor subunit TctC
VRRLHEEVAKAMADEGVRGKLAAAGAELALRSPKEFQAFVRQEIPRWAKVIEAGGVTAD